MPAVNEQTKDDKHNPADVVGSDLIALIDDERESDPSRKVLSREEAARVWGLIHRYPSWNDAYWTLLAAMKLSDEMDALPEGSADHAELAQELGSLLAAQLDIQFATPEQSEFRLATPTVPDATEVEVQVTRSTMSELIKQAHQAASKRRLTEARTLADQAYAVLSVSVSTVEEVGHENLKRLAQVYQAIGKRDRSEVLARPGRSPLDGTPVIAAAGSGAGRGVLPTERLVESRTTLWIGDAEYTILEDDKRMVFLRGPIDPAADRIWLGDEAYELRYAEQDLAFEVCDLGMGDLNDFLQSQAASPAARAIRCDRRQE